ncbi:hypothetical protein RF11_11675 [Thelohanellus kitauei]|uniref:Uncharacterized protein n=1 Tax=Thelohanellus kitauei TaxID=669202 RepID=A0A0C2IZV2_THEKT|nr:hypothetical protein RF11_11675 [Thelohanellus kitauei]
MVLSRSRIRYLSTEVSITSLFWMAMTLVVSISSLFLIQHTVRQSVGHIHDSSDSDAEHDSFTFKTERSNSVFRGLLSKESIVHYPTQDCVSTKFIDVFSISARIAKELTIPKQFFLAGHIHTGFEPNESCYSQTLTFLEVKSNCHNDFLCTEARHREATKLETSKKYLGVSDFEEKECFYGDQIPGKDLCLFVTAQALSGFNISLSTHLVRSDDNVQIFDSSSQNILLIYYYKIRESTKFRVFLAIFAVLIILELAAYIYIYRRRRIRRQQQQLLETTTDEACLIQPEAENCIET